MPTRVNSRRKPSKPRASFPLTPHNNGQWCKKIRGRLHFFGSWTDPEGALDRYLRVASDLHAGREPTEVSLSAGGVTVKEVCDHYLTYLFERCEGKEVSPAGSRTANRSQ